MTYTPEQLREWADEIDSVEHSFLRPVAIAEHYRAHAAALDEIEELRSKLGYEKAIVDRIWKIYGSPSYKSLNGKSIYDLIEDDKKKLAEREAEVAKLRRVLRASIEIRACAHRTDLPDIADDGGKDDFGEYEEGAWGRFIDAIDAATRGEQ